MSQRLADGLNLELAWQRTKLDRPDRVFVTNPYLTAIAEQDLHAYLAEVRELVARGYAPSPAGTCPVPEGRWQVRPGAYLRLEDEIVFNALVGRAFPNLIAKLEWSQGDPDVAYQLIPRNLTPHWLKRGVRAWTEWREESTVETRSSRVCADGRHCRILRKCRFAPSYVRLAVDRGRG